MRLPLTVSDNTAASASTGREKGEGQQEEQRAEIEVAFEIDSNGDLLVTAAQVGITAVAVQVCTPT